MEKRYNTLNNYLKEEFGEKVMKLSLDGGFTCPNRDGSVGNKGCIFCGEEGSGEFAGSRDESIVDQMDQQKKLLARKWKGNKYIAYFQNFTNTYGSVDRLRKLYFSALEEEGVVGLAIATRPDCIDEEILELLKEVNKSTYLWIELGLQTINPQVAKLIRRGYDLEVYDRAISRLRDSGIRVVTHVIVGLPNESRSDILDTIKYVGGTNTWGIKLHSLYIQKGTDLYDYYLEKPFPIMTREEYVSLIVDGLELIPKEMVVHRVTGDGKRSLLHKPEWSLDKLKVISMIDMEFKLRDSHQGLHYNR